MTIDELFKVIKNTTFKSYSSEDGTNSVKLKEFSGHNFKTIILLNEDGEELYSFSSFATMKSSENYEQISNFQVLEIEEINLRQWYDFYTKRPSSNENYIKIIVNK